MRIDYSMVFVAVALAAGCQTTPEHKPAAAPQEKQVVKADKDGVQRVQVVAGSYFFKPGHIVVKANAPVEFVARKEPGMAPHNLVIKAPEAGLAVEEDLGNEPRKIAFTATKPGKYEIYCSKKPPIGQSHRERGMVGVLEVVP
jgi:plastocyanin